MLKFKTSVFCTVFNYTQSGITRVLYIIASLMNLNYNDQVWRHKTGKKIKWNNSFNKVTSQLAPPL